MKTLLACLLSSAVAAGAIALCFAIAEGGFTRDILGMMVFAFLYVLIVAVVIGIPFRYMARRLGRQSGVCFATAGGLVGAAFVLLLLASGPFNSTLAKIALILAIAGSLAGWTFYRVSTHGEARPAKSTQPPSPAL